jgi:hypothetical protein
VTVLGPALLAILFVLWIAPLGRKYFRFFKPDNRWPSAVRELNLRQTEKSAPNWIGHHGGVPFSIEPGDTGNIELRCELTMAKSLCINAVGSSEPRVYVGDPSLDDVEIHGVEAEVIGLLDAETRAAIRRFTDCGGRLGFGRMILSKGPDGELPARVRLAVRLYRLLSRDNLAALLAHNARCDPVPAVRARNLRALGDKFQDLKESSELFSAALQDPYAAVKLVAARFERGEASSVTLRALVANEVLDPELRVEAFEQLLSQFGFSSNHDLVPMLLAAHGNDAVALTCSVALAVGKSSPQLGREDELALIALLGHDSYAVRAAAATALGQSGSLRAVEPLLPLSKTVLLTDTREAAQRAIRAIQARQGDAKSGWVSVAELAPDAGALSLAEQQAGAVSVAPGGTENSLAPPEEATKLDSSVVPTGKVVP